MSKQLSWFRSVAENKMAREHQGDAERDALLVLSLLKNHPHLDELLEYFDVFYGVYVRDDEGSIDALQEKAEKVAEEFLQGVFSKL